MKKVSISLFAILAIVFAIGSAFTTKVAKTTADQDFFELQNSSSVLEATFITTGEQTADGFQNLATYIEDVPIDYATARTNCGEEGDEDVVCAAELVHAESEALVQTDLTDKEFEEVVVSIIYRQL